jgi:hypothetical protein
MEWIRKMANHALCMNGMNFLRANWLICTLVDECKP